MQKIFRFALSSSRKRRCKALGMILWLLRQLRDAEDADLQRSSDFLDSLVPRPDSACRYAAAEDEYLACEHAVGTIDSAIEDLEFAY